MNTNYVLIEDSPASFLSTFDSSLKGLHVYVVVGGGGGGGCYSWCRFLPVGLIRKSDDGKVFERQH